MAATQYLPILALQRIRIRIPVMTYFHGLTSFYFHATPHFPFTSTRHFTPSYFHDSYSSPPNKSHPLNPLAFPCIPFFPRSYFHDLLPTIYLPCIPSFSYYCFHARFFLPILIKHLSSFALVDSTWTELGQSLDSAGQALRSTE